MIMIHYKKINMVLQPIKNKNVENPETQFYNSARCVYKNLTHYKNQFFFKNVTKALCVAVTNAFKQAKGNAIPIAPNLNQVFLNDFGQFFTALPLYHSMRSTFAHNNVQVFDISYNYQFFHSISSYISNYTAMDDGFKNLIYFGVANNGLKADFSRINQTKFSTERLDYSRNPVIIPVGTDLCIDLPQLKDLFLTECNLSAANLTHIVKSCQHLTSLDLSNNPFGSEQGLSLYLI